MKRVDLNGQRFGRLLVLDWVGPKWRCVCDCGAECLVIGYNLAHGETSSCGCLRRETAKITGNTFLKVHGGRYTAEYKVWQGMRQRCLNSNHPFYARYGGRGIKICATWESFEQFRVDMGQRPRGLKLERINNDGNYEPGNCRWATQSEQLRNTMNTRFVEYEGEKIAFIDLYDRIKPTVSFACAKDRLRAGWQVLDCFYKPVRLTKNREAADVGL